MKKLALDLFWVFKIVCKLSIGASAMLTLDNFWVGPGDFVGVFFVLPLIFLWIVQDARPTKKGE